MLMTATSGLIQCVINFSSRSSSGGSAIDELNTLKPSTRKISPSETLNSRGYLSGIVVDVAIFQPPLDYIEQTKVKVANRSAVARKFVLLLAPFRLTLCAGHSVT